MGSARQVHRCRLCRGGLSAAVLSLGDQPISNRLPRTRDAETPRYPLDIVLCGSCGLAQLGHDLGADEHFNDDYAYVSGASSTWVEHCRDYARGLVARHGVSQRDYVVEAGSNDGTLLKAFREAGVQGLGVEPSGNVAALAQKEGVLTVNAFFDADAAGKIRAEYGPPKAVIGNNVLAHTPDTGGFLLAARDLIAPDGFLCFEFPHVVNILERRYFDTIYHEHYAYLGVGPLQHWAQQNGMEVYAVEPQPTHGGSLRAFLRHATGAPTPADVLALIDQEKRYGPEAWAELADWLVGWRDAFWRVIRDLQAEGRRIAGYAAASKATVICNYLGLTDRDLAFCCDASPYKIGRFIPGTGIPILAPDALQDDEASVFVVFAWNIFDEIREKVALAKDGPVRFIRPLPKIEVVGRPQMASA